MSADRRDARTHVDAAARLTDLGRYEMAAAEARSALALDPASASAHALLGNALSELSDGLAGIEEAQEAIRLQPSHAGFHGIYAGILRARGRLDEAETECRTRMQLAPRDPTAYRKLAEILVARDRADEALAVARAGLLVGPLDHTVHNAESISLLHLGRFREAAQAAGRGLAIAPDSATLQTNLGLAIMYGGDPDAAQVKYREAARLDPSLRAPVWNLEYMQRLARRRSTISPRERATSVMRFVASQWWWARRAAATRVAIILGALLIGLILPFVWIVLADCLWMESANSLRRHPSRPWHSRGRRMVRKVAGIAGNLVTWWILASVGIVAAAWYGAFPGALDPEAALRAVAWSGFAILVGIGYSFTLAIVLTAEGRLRWIGVVLFAPFLAAAIAATSLPSSTLQTGAVLVAIVAAAFLPDYFSAWCGWLDRHLPRSTPPVGPSPSPTGE